MAKITIVADDIIIELLTILCLHDTQVIVDILSDSYDLKRTKAETLTSKIKVFREIEWK